MSLPKSHTPLNALAEKIHVNAQRHGWWDTPVSFGDVAALVHSEVSEAFEEYRNDNGMFYVKDGKPEGIAVELIDAVIRILDYLASEGVDIDTVMQMKHEYNKERPYRHGGKKL